MLTVIAIQTPTFLNPNVDWQMASEAARTVPGRENGGNCDIKNLSRGCKVYFPVFVEVSFTPAPKP